MGEEEKVTPRIVEAVAVSGNAAGTLGGKSPLARYIEHAMSRAVEQCYAKGIHDPEVVREAMQRARVATREWFYNEIAKIEAEQAKRRELEG